MNVYDREIFNTDRAVSHGVCIYRLSYFSGNFSRDITEQELQNCKKSCVVFERNNCINEMLDHDLQFKAEVNKIL